ncbi:MAG TPA: 4-vinyl reductase [Anaerolineaceae bacterium]|nr:4-vinyl reductase [Anaerolineaceae bacterium]
MTRNGQNYYCSNQMGRMILLGMEEIMGEGGVQRVLERACLADRMAVPPPNDADFCIHYADISVLQQTMEQLYGPLGGKGLAVRSGRASFRYGLRLFGKDTGLAELDYRLLPHKSKLSVGAGSLAALLSRISDQSVQMREDDQAIYWSIERCPLCWGRRADGPVCHLQVGFLEEFLFWASEGKFFSVVETECAAAGAASCLFRIDKQPLD